MKINLLFIFLFISIIIIASDNGSDETNLIGCTELNGNGCVCHTTERDFGVNVWIEGPETLYVGETGLYKMFLSNGPAEAGGYNVAGRFGTMVLVDSFSYQHPLAMNELTQAFSLPFPTPEDTIYWEFGYLASDFSSIDTIYSCGISLVWDSIPNELDRWNFGSKFPVTVLEPTVAISTENNLLEEFNLEQNYPNPFNPVTKIKFTIPPNISNENKHVILRVYDIHGKEIKTLIHEEKSSGNYEVKFDGSALASGIYFYSLQLGGITHTKKMILLR